MADSRHLEKSKIRHLSNGLANLDEIWQTYADWVYQAYQPVKI